MISQHNFFAGPTPLFQFSKFGLPLERRRTHCLNGNTPIQGIALTWECSLDFVQVFLLVVHHHVPWGPGGIPLFHCLQTSVQTSFQGLAGDAYAYHLIIHVSLYDQAIHEGKFRRIHGRTNLTNKHQVTIPKNGNIRIGDKVSLIFISNMHSPLLSKQKIKIFIRYLYLSGTCTLIE